MHHCTNNQLEVVPDKSLDIKPIAKRVALVLGAIAIAACSGGGGNKDSNQANAPIPGVSITNPDAAASDKPFANATDAVRFLHKASFGPTEAESDAVKKTGPRKWLVAQFAQPASLYAEGGNDAIDKWQDKNISFCDGGGYATRTEYTKQNCWAEWYSADPLKREFFKQATANADQLRQRVAFALSQILVISNNDVDGTYGLRDYYNTLRANAFGNYRTVLEKVTLHPMMGDYLGMVNNNKLEPNENYARELLQLFSIGTCKLNPDGSMESGKCISTYENNTVREYAYALTGWTFPVGGYNPYCANGKCNDWRNARYRAGQMLAVEKEHDNQARTLLSTVSVPATRTAQKSLDLVLDSLMNHPNVGPFVGKQLIQFFVTSNPSSAYVKRVADAFNAGKYSDASGTIGGGQRGDLQATISAVLLDDEALATTTANDFGKLREPVLYMTGAIRALAGRTDGQPLGNYWWGANLGQPVFNSPTVFNFYPPDFPLPGAADKLAPQFGIENSNTTLGRINFANDLIFWWYNKGTGLAVDPKVPDAIGTRVDYAQWESLADKPADVVNRLDLLLTGGTTGQAQRDAVVAAMNTWTSADDSWLTSASTLSNFKRERVKTAAYLLLASPNYQVQR
jgi:uncharacterized protein (DUF1800 family)